MLAAALALVTALAPAAAGWLPMRTAVVEPDADGTATVWKLPFDPGWERAPISPGAGDRRVPQLQRHLAELGVFRGEIDGEFGRQTAAAVVAVHKLAGIDRTTTWAVEDWSIELDHSLILAQHPNEPDRLEVDLGRQVLFVIRDSEVAAIIPVSTGNGEVYWSKNSGYVTARTPRGNFRLFKHVSGWRVNYLGALYKPWYFTPYYAVHGSGSVPAYPASHGCVRVPTWESDHLDALLEIGLPIHIWDQPVVPEPVDEPAPPSDPPDDLV